jgi:phosphoribosylanthranilate isomerase
VIVQVYTVQTPAEAVQLSRLGVDHVGVTISERGLPGEVGMSTGRQIVAALEDSPSRCVALTVETHLEEIQDFVAELEPDILHLCGDTDLLRPADVAELRAWLRRRRVAAEIMQAIGVTGSEAVEQALAYEPHVDWILLDSVSESVEGIGASGVVHDWEVSREIVQAMSVPVILAGGLGPENVAEAIANVGPAGVDSLTRTNRDVGDGSFRKDLDAVGRFVTEARRAQ